jgi:hypothetical protein
MWNRSPATLIRNLGTGCELSVSRSGRFTRKVPIKQYVGCAPQAVCCSCSNRTTSLRVCSQQPGHYTKLGYSPQNCLLPFSRTSDRARARARAQCSKQRHSFTAQLLSALKTPNVTDGAAASQKAREVRPTAILARNCEYCALGQHLHQ